MAIPGSGDTFVQTSQYLSLDLATTHTFLLTMSCQDVPHEALATVHLDPVGDNPRDPQIKQPGAPTTHFVSKYRY